MSTPAELVAEAEELANAVYEQPRLTGQAAARLMARADAAGAVEAAVVAARVNAMAAIYGNRIDDALDLLTKTVRRADRAGLTERAGEARTTLAFAQSLAGRLRVAARTLDRAVDEVPRSQQGRAAQTRAFVLGQAGRITESLAAFDLARDRCVEVGDRRGETIVANNRALVLISAGALDEAAASLHRAEAIATEMGDQYLVACAHQNLGIVTGAQGDIPGALAWYDRAAAELAQTNAPKADDLMDRAETLLGAGLPGEAHALAERAAAELADAGTKATLAEARLLMARASLAEGDAAGARTEAEAAQRAFAAQGRRAWAALAGAVALHATWRLVPDDPTLLARARRTGDRLAAAGWDVAAAEARVLAGRIALNLGRRRAARSVLAQSAGLHRRTVALGVAAAHAEALLRLADGDRAGAEASARAGLARLEEHRARLGSVELRSAVAASGDDLARVGLRIALADGDPARVLDWAERWRAGALRLRPVRPEPGELGHELAALRSLAVAVERARLEGRPVAELADRLARAEAAVQARMRRLGGREAPAASAANGRRDGETRSTVGATAVAGADTSAANGAGTSVTAANGAGTVATAEFAADELIDVDELAAALGERALLEYLALDGRLAALTLTADDGLRLHDLGPVPDVAAAVDDLRSSLRRLTRRRGPASLRGASQASADASAAALHRALVEPLAKSIAERALVIVPTGALHALPWAMLPDLRGRPLAVAPSARLWRRAEQAAGAGSQRRRGGRTVLVQGPDLPGAAAEIESLAGLYGSARRFTGEAATAAATAKAMDGATLAHVACHGTFRADNPLFSALHLADGPLTLYDLKDLDRAPRLVVLSACDVGLSGVLPGDELRGLATALLGIGTSSIVASVTPVPDDVAVGLMVAFHEGLRSGLAPAEALARAESDLGGEAGAGGFVCLGAG